MPTTNYDASELLRFRIGRTLASFNKSRFNTNGSVAGPIIEQQTYSTQDVYVERKQGGLARIVDGVTQVPGCCGKLADSS